MRIVKCIIDNNQLKKDMDYLLIGEIDNMPEHFVVADSDGNIFWGYHMDNFMELESNEI